MLLTIGTSPVINRRTSSPVERGLGLGYKSHLSYDLLSPPQFTSTGLLPKPPDQPLVKPYEPPQPPEWPDPPDPPPDPLESEQRASLPQIETKNHHSSNPSPLLLIRWVLTLSHPPWLTLQGLTSGLSKSPSIELPSDANPQPSMCWWSLISLVFPTTMELTLRSPTLKPDVQPPHLSLYISMAGMLCLRFRSRGNSVSPISAAINHHHRDIASHLHHRRDLPSTLSLWPRSNDEIRRKNPTPPKTKPDLNPPVPGMQDIPMVGMISIRPAGLGKSSGLWL
ncbi:hypothetical protein AALP_AA7G217500 [Arabis alpina]|uniref:Uncharacterized protein n=1 Tax=Arabis alpina TaxID=50452 RepID=A0A087GJQ4_ARAAL|nr:hypothetical protein AALP_AA7G217500 [Arabis alpina]